MQPRIAIPFPYFDHAWSSRSLAEYVNAVSLAGGEPLVIAHSAAPALAAHLVKTCAAIVLPGSPADLDPEKYGEARDPRTAPADPARDMLDELLLQDAHAMRKPILGVCYGVQSLNVWRSGTLVQHIESAVLHQRPEGAPEGTVISHDAVVLRKSRLGEILAGHVAETAVELKSPQEIKSGLAGSPEFKLTVNSSHHQSVGRLGDGLRIVARSPRDGIIEAVENASEEHFVLGVQWHPERTYQQDACSRAIFAALVKAASQWHERMASGNHDFETAAPRL
ncbi:MAG: gamma-glutamyl-gamma-aminobutyrate hydrolase family protein [Candidatus Korobacteraceae bacterium]|jgi:putative glutamine amidotransferase